MTSLKSRSLVLLPLCLVLIPMFQNCSGFRSSATSQINPGSQDTGSGGGGTPNLGLKTDDGCVLNLAGDCDSPIAAYSINGKIVSSYPSSSPLFHAVRIPDLAATDVLAAGQGNFSGGQGTPDTTQISTWLAAGPKPNSYAVVTKVYDQSGHQNDAYQNTLASAPKLNVDSLSGAANALSLVFSNDMQSALQAYATDPTMGNTLSIASITNSNPTTLTLAPLPVPTLAGYTTGAYPLIPTPDYWILPGFVIGDKSLPSGGLTVLASTATSITLQGQPTETTKFSPNLKISVPNIFLDLPNNLNVQMNNFSVLMSLRTGCVGTPYYVTLGPSGETPAGSLAYASFYNTSSGFSLTANDPNVTGGLAAQFTAGNISSNMDVYFVTRGNGGVNFYLGEMGNGAESDSFSSNVQLNGGSIGFTNQISAGSQGAFEGYGFLIYNSALSANDASVIQQTLKNALQIPTPENIRLVYTGFSTVIGHGIDSVEAPAKRLAEDFAITNGMPIQVYSSMNLSENLNKVLQPGKQIAALYKPGATNILVVRPTVGDSFANFLQSWPTQQCGPQQNTTLEACLWAFLAPALTTAHNAGWKILLLSSEGKGVFIGDADGNLQDFLNFKSLALNGYAAAGADAYLDMETNPYFGGDNGSGGPNHCPFWNGGCINYVDPLQTQTYWQPDAKHFKQAAYDLSADMIFAAIKANAGVFLP